MDDAFEDMIRVMLQEYRDVCMDYQRTRDMLQEDARASVSKNKLISELEETVRRLQEKAKEGCE